MSVLNDKEQCVLIFGLGRRTGSEGPERFGHGHIGLILDPKASKEYRRSFLNVLIQKLAPEIRRLGESSKSPKKIRYNFTHKDPLNTEDPPLEVGPLTHIDVTLPSNQNDLRDELLTTGFHYDVEGAIDLRKETEYLSKSTFETLEKDFLSKFQGNLVEYQRYLITGPKGEDVAIWYSSKWGGLKLCLVHRVT